LVWGKRGGKPPPTPRELLISPQSDWDRQGRDRAFISTSKKTKKRGGRIKRREGLGGRQAPGGDPYPPYLWRLIIKKKNLVRGKEDLKNARGVFGGGKANGHRNGIEENV